MIDSKISISANYLIKALLLVIGITAVLYYGSGFLMPLFIATIIAILLDSPTKKMNQWGFPNWLSITLSIILMIIIFSLLTWLISSQVNTNGRRLAYNQRKGQ